MLAATFFDQHGALAHQRDGNWLGAHAAACDAMGGVGRAHEGWWPITGRASAAAARAVAIQAIRMSPLILARTGVRSPRGLQPQRVTSRMKVNFSSLRARRIRRVERMKIKDSPAARGAQAAKTFTLQRLIAGIAVGRLLRDMREDPGFDPSAIGAEAVALELGKLAADPADLLDPPCLASVEETQSCIEHHGPFSVSV
jgi:hypothetical protein